MNDQTRYILNNYADLMTAEERAAYRLVHADAKAQDSDSPAMQATLRRRWVSDDPQVQGLLRDGAEAFFRNTRDRILGAHAGDLTLNRCPRCGALARTPRARQCPKCFHSWHDAT